jgi:iron(III) transport system permease protein
VSEAALGRIGAPPRIDRGAVIQWATAVFTVILVLLPIAPILVQALLDRPIYEGGGQVTAANFSHLLADAEFLRATLNSLVFALLTTVFSIVVGVAAAIAVGRTDMPARGLVGEVMLWPVYVSHLVLAFGFSIIYGPSGYLTQLVATLTDGEPLWELYTIPAMAVVAGVSQAPLTFLYCIGTTKLADPALEDAARIVGAGPMRTLLAVTLPLMRPAILYSTVLNLTVALELLAIPLIFGGPVGIEFLTTFLYDRGVAASTPDYGLVGSAAVILLLVITGLVWLQNRILGDAGRFVTLGGKAARPRLFGLGKLRWVVFAVLALYLLLSIVAPLAGLVLRAFTSFLSPMVPITEVLTTAHFETVLSAPAYLRSIANTMGIAVFGGIAATVFVAVVTLVIHRSEFRYRRLLEFVALYPRAVPGLVVGLGYLWAMILLPPVGWLHNTIWILVLAYMMRYLPTGFGAISPMLLQIGKDLDRSSRTVGADWWTTCRAIVLPLLKPALFSCFAVMFIHFLKEYASAVFLFAPGSEVIGTTLLSFWIQGDAGPVAALSTVQVALTFLFVWAARRLLGAKVYG